MSKRLKVGEIEIGVIRSIDPSKTSWIVYRYRARTNEYLSKLEAPTFERAEYLFTQVVRQEELRQKREAAEAAALVQQGSFATDFGLAEVDFYKDHPYYSRF